MSKRILTTEVTIVGKPDILSWRPHAAMRYSDAPRGFEDATLWVCLHGDRPIAFQKVESMLPDKDRGPLWGHCFVSATEDFIEVRWDTGREWKATAPELTWKTLSDAQLPAESPRQRRLQCRRISEQFSATLIEAASGDSQEMRRLPRPICELTDGVETYYLGAVFGLTANGTNPDVLLLLEVHPDTTKPGWRYAFTRMTNGGVAARYGENNIWSVEPVPTTKASFPEWLFFNEPRTVTER